MRPFLNLLLIAAALCCMAGTASAQQRTCGTMAVLERTLQEHPELLQLRETREKLIRDHQSGAQERFYSVVTIPVVVHVVWFSGVPAQNVSDAQIASQISVLNADFRKLNSDVGNVPSHFSTLVADAQIEFCMAQRDPEGNPTNGITRTMSSTSSWSDNDNVKYTSLGGADVWDSEEYLNIWVCNLGGGLLGYAQFPGMGSPLTDGVVIDYQAFGTTGTAQAPFHRGRTATHEIGHWLDLLHIWGDDGSACTGTDLVADTPNQADETYNCPTGVQLSCGNSPNGDMYMNYMDYVDDPCMIMFTTDQVARMRASIETTRKSIVNSIACYPPSPCDNQAAPTLANISGPSMLCTTGSQVYGAYTSSISPYVPECMTGVWSVSWSGGLQIINQVVVDDGTAYAQIKALQPGNYTLTFTVTVNSAPTQTVSKSFPIKVCAIPTAPISSPPPGLESICTSNDPECYTFNNNCGLTFLLSTNDPKLIATANGSTICLSSIYYKRRTSRLSVTPVNSCGQGVTSVWYINIDNSEDCFFLTPPPNGPGADDEANVPEPGQPEYRVSNAGNQVRIEDRSVTADQQEKTIQLLAIDGRVLIDYKTEDALIQIDLGQEYPSGIYLLRILKGGQVYSKKIAVQN